MTPEEELKGLLAEEPCLSSLEEWRKINGPLGGRGLEGVTAKMEIGQHDLYVKTSWFDGNIVRIDVTLSHGRDSSDDLPLSVQQASLETTRFDLARSWVESECRMASNLLQTGCVGIGNIMDEWAGVEGYPSGHCPQILGANPETGEMGPTFQKGPLHAVAMLLRLRLVDWSRKMRGRV